MKTYFVCLATLTLAACAPNNSGKPEAERKIAAFNYTGNGTDVTQEFIAKHKGQFREPDFNEGIKIEADGTFVREVTRQVGRHGDSVAPYPTVCSYRKTGKLVFVELRSAEDRARYIDFATHEMVYQIESVQAIAPLRPGDKDSANCPAYLERLNKEIAEGSTLQWSTPMEILSDSQIRIHTSGGGDYQQGGQRTPSTLDELYTKQSK